MSDAVGTSTFNHWYDYNGRGLLWKVSAATTQTKPTTADVTYLYRPSGAVSSRQYGSLTAVPMRYTIREELQRIGDPAVTTYPFSARYAYHENGTVSESEFYSGGSPASQKRYRFVYGTAAYDALNRLKSADYSGWTGSAWSTTLAYDLTNLTYDRSGNLVTGRRYRSAATLVDNLTYTTPAGSNRLSSVSDAAGTTTETWDAEAGSLTYNANGNVLTVGAPYSITAATYDARNLPLSLTRGGVVTTYRYDQEGLRIAKRVGSGNTEVYLRAGGVELAVFVVNGSGVLQSSYFNVVAGDKVVGRQPSSGSRLYYHRDLLGSTRAVVQGTTVVESRDYDPWGVLMAGRTLGTGTTKEGFSGKERDAETGLDYFGFRYYMSALGRWTTTDPLTDEFPEWNGYNYVENQPTRLVDPWGLAPLVVDEEGCPPKCGARDALDLGVGFTPGVSTVADATTVATGRNPVTGEEVGLGGRGWALAGVLSPLSGGQIRGVQGFLDAADIRLGEEFGTRFFVKVRQALGRSDDASSAIIREVDRGGNSVSLTHRVVRPDGSIVHQHQTHIGAWNQTERSFPDAWVQFPRIDHR